MQNLILTRRKMLQTIGLGAAATTGILGHKAAWAQVNRSGAGGLAPPSNGSFLIPIIQKLKLDKQNDLDFDVNLYSDPSVLYSDLASSRTSHIFGAIYNCANFYVRGVPLQLLFTISTANHAFISKDPAIRTPQDLEGKTIAATTSSGFYGMAELFLKQNDLDPRRNLNLINSPPSSVRTQLLADKVDAGLLFDPALSEMLTHDFHMVGDMNAGIRQALSIDADAPVWYLGAYAQKEWIDENPKRAASTLKMWQEAANFYNNNPEEADAIISEFTRVPLEALALSRKFGITQFKIEPAIEQKDNINALFRGFKDVNFLTDLPDEGIYYDWGTSNE